MQLVRESLLTSEMPKLEDLTSRISSLSTERRGPSVEEVENMALQLMMEIDERLRSETKRDANLILESIIETPRGYGLPGFRIAASKSYRLKAGMAETRLDALVLYSQNVADPFPFVVDSVSNNDELEIRMEDVHPELSESLKVRLTHWVQRRLADMFKDLEEQLRS